MNEILRVYADTSVFGGPFDPEFAEASTLFFDQVRLGRFGLVISGVVQAEIEPAPPEVRRLFDEMVGFAEIVEPSSAALQLRDAYLEAGIVGPNSADDAFHVALATVSSCSVIVSWNFQHIVHFRKIPLYNAVNSFRGFPALSIYSPREVIDYEEKSL
jgi:hypothetical protein